MHEVGFRALGPIEVAVDGVVHPVGGPKQRALLAVLLVEAPRPVTTGRLLDELWGDAPPATASSSLQVHVYTLRRLVADRLRTLPGAYALDVAAGDVDVQRFTASAATGHGLLADDPATASITLAEALSLWRGEAFSDVPHTPAVAAAAARLNEARLAAEEDRAEADLALGRHEERIGELTGLVRAHPTRERLVGLLMLALHRSGRSGDALRVYQQLCAVLDRELGVDPGDELVALQKAIRRGDPTLVPAGPEALPAPAGRFVGRRRELDEAARALLDARLLTLLGPGGSGKSRLALEMARQVSAAHPGGIHMVELASLTADQSVVHRVASALGIGERLDASIDAAVVAHLRHRRVLLLIDNCEHVAAGAAAVCAEILERCPGVRILATSRERLGVSGEVVWPLPPMALPRPGAGLQEVQASDAVQLMVERARSARPGLRIGDEDLGEVAAICGRLDGLPLAIELAAARLRSFSVAELSRLLAGGLDVLGGAAPGSVPRHQTLRAAIEWSHRLLDDAERASFRRLSVLSGGGELEAALAVAADPGGPPPRTPREAADVLARLVDRSLVAPAPGETGTRYRMLELVREYAAERLAESGERARARARHAAWFARQAEESLVAVSRDHGLKAERLADDDGNLVAALDWLLGEGGDPERGMETAASLWRYWWARGMLTEGRSWLRRALAAGSPEPTRSRALALRGAAALARMAADGDEARRLGEEALEAVRRLGDEASYPACLNGLANAAMIQGDAETALRYSQESVAWAERTGNQLGTALSGASAALALRELGRLDEAEALLHRSLATCREHGDRINEGVVLSQLARISRMRGRRDAARDLWLDALALDRELQVVDNELDVLDSLAGLEAELGHPETALRVLTVTGRERGQTGYGTSNARDAAARSAVTAAVTAALGEEAARSVTEAARDLDLDDVVDELLAGRRRAPG